MKKTVTAYTESIRISNTCRENKGTEFHAYVQDQSYMMNDDGNARRKNTTSIKATPITLPQVWPSSTQTEQMQAMSAAHCTYGPERHLTAQGGLV